ncbi:MAG TPA: alkene reductase [Candidatus Angelobacter sp.]|nr:alkene reductase [Candidatus Angelobacter sp.]
MTEFAPQPLLTPFSMGELLLPNRIVMAPLTRMRTANPGHVPTLLQAQYYGQRASAGVIISEGIAISPEGYGWANTPGLWNEKQVSGWRVVTDAVHEAGGRILAQLWHTGAISHPDLLNGALPVSASDVNPLQQSVTPTGRKPTVNPRPMTKNEIRQTVADYGEAALNAMKAGFDGVQVQANYLYLIPQFLNRTTNLRTDEYGGSIENRARFLFEVLESILEVLESEMVGIKLAPMHEKGPFAANDETLATIEYIVARLNDYSLSHLLMMGASTDFSDSPLAALAGDGMFQHFRPIFKGPLIANVKMDRERGNRLISEGLADLIAFGRLYIANPDLVARFAANTPLNNDIRSETIYGSGPEGYVDYPDLTLVN